ncbi:unnamed protein product [Plutella xylostella]|uniref:(diamondback moth) hypothetical protein n=1 Tax=Plutella xylostella TaxID=51655 RepID=A0A8S4DFU8_PLUXY|nr:unnamed protein product [Plutella xylostella]
MLQPWLLACLWATSLAQMRPGQGNRVVDVKTTCNKESFSVQLEMERPFKGLIFSKDFSRECRAQGNQQSQITIHIPSNACGVRTSALNSSLVDPDDEEHLYYSVELVVQMDRQLQQSTDQEIFVRCKLQPRAVRINSPALDGVIQNKLREMIGQDAKKTR